MQGLRIQKGNLRGRKIAAPPAVSGNSHLTLALVKEALFQVLLGRLDDFTRYAFFDLCAGSGQMAFEAVSLGFQPVHLAEIDPGRLNHLIQEVRRWKYPVEIHKRDFRRMAPLVFQQPRSIVFLDPPYSFWDGGRSEAVDRLVYNLLHPAETEAGPPRLVEDIWFIVHGPAEYEPAPEILRDDGPLALLEIERRDYRRQRIAVLRIGPRASAPAAAPEV